MQARVDLLLDPPAPQHLAPFSLVNGSRPRPIVCQRSVWSFVEKVLAGGSHSREIFVAIAWQRLGRNVVKQVLDAAVFPASPRFVSNHVVKDLYFSSLT